LAVEQHVGHLAPVGAAVHPHETAYGAGNTAQELQPGDAGVARGRRHEDAARPPAATHDLLLPGLDMRERLAKAHDNAGHAAVANDEVGAEAERHHWSALLQSGKEGDQV